MLIKINNLIKDTKRTPLKGLGKPEPLKGDLSVFGQDGFPVSIGLSIAWLEKANLSNWKLFKADSITNNFHLTYIGSITR